MENLSYFLWIVGGIAFVIAVLTGTIKFTWGRIKPQLTDEEIIKSIDSKYFKDLIERDRKAQIVFRQVWSENEKEGRKMHGECWAASLEEGLSISKEEAFALNLVWEDYSECVAIFFIRKGVKAHYDELRHQSGEATDHLKHKEQ